VSSIHCIGAVAQVAELTDRMAEQHADAPTDQAKSALDSMSELGEEQSLRLQMAMDRLSKMEATLANVLREISETDSTLVQNLK
jgi:hypothetical protein